jgi:hypothetical protein
MGVANGEESAHVERGPPGPLKIMMRTWRSALQDNLRIVRSRFAARLM